MAIEHQEIDNLFPSKTESYHNLTVEEIEDILRYAQEQGINSAATAQLLRWIKLKKAAHQVAQTENETK